METQLIVLDPVTDDLRRLPILRFPLFACSAVVLCATAGCDHLDCRGGRFLLVGAATDVLGERCTSTIAYSSEQGAWSEPITMQHHNDCILGGHHALVGNAGYFNFQLNTRILEYDLGRREMSIIDLPSEFHG
ncbi:hypothetical protein BAE44_0000819 [Dichanthelium oligosanthes]|uniref:F-box/kelch-repeat protein n=1 Tax=Dichanthelium oligosanthes TaxID=888268 RepID=A0A1E5WL78_9POAL|nr:hypothetical protein BAE44_0000819 [Dichanthelium oligosanthes]